MVKTLFVSVWFLMHPVHVTLTSIDYVPDPVGYNVFVRMYFDDFLADCKLNGKIFEGVDFSDGNRTSRDAMEKYLSEKLIIKVNEKLISGKLSDMKVADNEISMNLKYDGGRKPATILVKNLILTDLYSDMSNMVIVKVDDFEVGVKLTSDMTEQIFKIK